MDTQVLPHRQDLDLGTSQSRQDLLHRFRLNLLPHCADSQCHLAFSRSDGKVVIRTYQRMLASIPSFFLHTRRPDLFHGLNLKYILIILLMV